MGTEALLLQGLCSQIRCQIARSPAIVSTCMLCYTKSYGSLWKMCSMYVHVSIRTMHVHLARPLQLQDPLHSWRGWSLNSWRPGAQGCGQDDWGVSLRLWCTCYLLITCDKWQIQCNVQDILKRIFPVQCASYVLLAKVAVLRRWHELVFATFFLFCAGTVAFTSGKFFDVYVTHINGPISFYLTRVGKGYSVSSFRPTLFGLQGCLFVCLLVLICLFVFPMHWRHDGWIGRCVMDTMNTYFSIKPCPKSRSDLVVHLKLWLKV